jgi:hypothetical protein
MGVWLVMISPRPPDGLAYELRRSKAPTPAQTKLYAGVIRRCDQRSWHQNMVEHDLALAEEEARSKSRHL